MNKPIKSIDGITPRRRIESMPPVVIRKPGHGRRLTAGQSIDGIKRAPRPKPVQIVQTAWQERPRVGFDRPEFIRDPVLLNKPETKSSKFRKFLALLQYPLTALILIIAIYSTTIGQWLIVAYAIYAIVRGVQSRNTFVAALLLLIAIPIFQLLNQPGVADNIAVYAYELLVVGTLQAIIELLKDSKRKRTLV